MSDDAKKARGTIWILVDHSSREATYEGVADLLRSEPDVEAHTVTISEVLGSVARGALTGGAERLLRGLRVAMRGRAQDEDFLGAVKRARPDLLAVTNPRWVRALGLLESMSGIPALQIGVFPDYDFDETWCRSSLHGFVVPHDEFARRLRREGVAEHRILVAGPAIRASFARELDRAAERESFGFADDQQVVLVRAEALEATLLEKCVFQATLVERNARFVFHHNGDGAVASALRRAAAQYGLKAAMFGRVDDLERYVLAADAVVAGPRDPLVPEILALDRPLLFVGPDHGASAQIEFLADVGAAGSVQDVLRLGSELERFLEEGRLEAARAAAQELSRNDGSRLVADALLEALANREEWLAAPHPVEEPAPPTDDEGGDEQPRDEEPASPFETIGTTTAPSEPGESRTEAPRHEPTLTGLSRAAAKEQLAALILSEREIERKLADAEKQQQRWRSRLEMAREWNEEDLAVEAEAILRGYLDEAESLQAERASILRQKEKLKQAALGGESRAAGPMSDGGATESRLADVEKRFRKMEVDSDLDDLKDRIRRELGE